MKSKHLLQAAAGAALVLKLRILPERLALLLGRLVCTVLYHVGLRRNVVEENISRSMPELSASERAAIVKQLYASVGEFAALFARPGRISWSRVKRVGVEHIEAAHAKGKGGIILLGHLGNWEMMGRLFSTFPFRCYVVAKPMENPVVERFVLRTRQRGGLRVIYQKNAMKEIVKALAENSFVGILVDQDAGEQGVMVDFFGRPASTVPTVASLALKYNCPVLPVHLFKTGDGSYRFQVEEPVEPARTGDRNRDLLLTTRKYNELLERLIRRYPSQYFGWFHRRWKSADRSRSQSHAG